MSLFVEQMIELVGAGWSEARSQELILASHMGAGAQGQGGPFCSQHRKG